MSDDNLSPHERRRRQIALSRERLAARYEADPEGVARFNARLAHLDAARRREQARIDQLVLSKRREPAPLPKKPAGMSRAEWKAEKARLRAEAAKPSTLAEKWSHRQGTPETLEHAETTHVDCLDQLERNGTIDKEQREWAAQIANVYRSIESDVAVSIASLEARVDNQRGDRNGAAESVRRVRLHFAYSAWRAALPDPKQMVLDMIVGDAIGYTVAARRYRVRKERARARLLDAIDSWPGFVDRAYRAVSEEDVARANAA